MQHDDTAPVTESTAPQYPTIQANNLRAVLAQIEAHPETWNQSAWHCDTSHCFGGWAQIMAGCPAADDSVRCDARRFLGLTRYEADRLFAGYNSLPALRAMVEELTSAGYNRDGWDRDGYDRAGYDRDGYDRDGYDTDGLNARNQTREEAQAVQP